MLEVITFIMNHIIVIGVFVLLTAFMLQRWLTSGRDVIKRGTIIPYYNIPDNLSILDASAIMYGDLRMRDCSALIIQCTIKGYLKVKQGNKDEYILHRLKSYDFLKKALSQEELFFIKSLFGFVDQKKVIKISDFESQSYDAAVVLQEKVRDRLKSEGYLTNSGEIEKKLFVWLGSSAVLISWYVKEALGLQPLIVSIIVLVVLVVFSKIMTSRTAKGVAVRDKLLGFKMYLNVAEKDRLKFHNAPKRKPETFEEFLPYAMVLDVDKVWVQQFSDIYTSAPKWFWGSGPDLISTTSLREDLAVFTEVLDFILTKNRK